MLSHLKHKFGVLTKTVATFSQLKSIHHLKMTAKPRVFISRRIPEESRAVVAAECKVTEWDKDDPPPRQEYMERVKGINGLYCLLTDKIDAELLDAAGPDLRVISTMSVGHNHIDLEECLKRNIKVGYTPDILTNATAELAVALLLATSRRLKEGIRAVENGEWGTWKPLWMCGQGLDGATVGIVGMGRIGHKVAQCLKPFGVANFLYCGRSRKLKEEEELGAKFVPFKDLLAQSDFVLACCALSDETRGMFNKGAFQGMKKTGIFVNISRGEVVNQEDLYEALHSGTIGAAGLDVTTPEPLPTDSPLLKLSNCVVLPHIGSATFDSREAMAMLAARNLVEGLRGGNMPAQLQF